MANVTPAISNWQGPLPIDGDAFTPTSNGTFLLFASGSGWSTGGAALIGMNVIANGTWVGSSQVWTNPAYSHAAFVPICVPLSGLTPGQPVTVRLEAFNETTTDLNDYFNVTVVEID
jgi:hypothetical protein